MSDLGDSRVSIFLKNVTEDNINDIAGALADVFVDHGFNTSNDESAPGVLMHIEAWPWPLGDGDDGDADKFVAELGFAGGMLLIPGAPE